MNKEWEDLARAAEDIPRWVAVAMDATKARAAGKTPYYPPGTPVNIHDLERILQNEVRA